MKRRGYCIGLTAISTATVSPRFTPASAEGGACKSSVPASAVFRLNEPYELSILVT